VQSAVPATIKFDGIPSQTCGDLKIRAPYDSFNTRRVPPIFNPKGCLELKKVEKYFSNRTHLQKYI